MWPRGKGLTRPPGYAGGPEVFQALAHRGPRGKGILCLTLLTKGGPWGSLSLGFLGVDKSPWLCWGLGFLGVALSLWLCYTRTRTHNRKPPWISSSAAPFFHRFISLGGLTMGSHWFKLCSSTGEKGQRTGTTLPRDSEKASSLTQCEHPLQQRPKGQRNILCTILLELTIYTAPRLYHHATTI